MNCVVTAGICSKPERTYGEPHYCESADFHDGAHRCRRCGMEFNADSVAPWVFDMKREKRKGGSEA